jgi:hypothetical protein
VGEETDLHHHADAESCHDGTKNRGAQGRQAGPIRRIDRRDSASRW